MRTLESMKFLIRNTEKDIKKNKFFSLVLPRVWRAELARVLRGTKFKAGVSRVTPAKLLGQLSSLGKLQAVLACSVPGCKREHVREQSDWHQSLRCPEHQHTKEA